jgi:hypothetical protein
VGNASNFAFLSYAVNEETGLAVALAAIDNLGKGASGYGPRPAIRARDPHSDRYGTQGQRAAPGRKATAINDC